MANLTGVGARMGEAISPDNNNSSCILCSLVYSAQLKQIQVSMRKCKFKKAVNILVRDGHHKIIIVTAFIVHHILQYTFNADTGVRKCKI